MNSMALGESKIIKQLGYYFAVTSIFIGPLILNVAGSLGTPAYLDCSDYSLEGLSYTQREEVMMRSLNFVNIASSIMLIAAVIVCALTLFFNRKRFRRAINPVLAVTLVSMGYFLMLLVSQDISCS
jgi:hypothetical protein